MPWWYVDLGEVGIGIKRSGYTHNSSLIKYQNPTFGELSMGIQAIWSDILFGKHVSSIYKKHKSLRLE